MGGAGATPFRTAYEDTLRQLTAELRSRGLSDDQIKEVIADNFPN
jgi:microsomal dipeptidase-like Zn-dependent dipeptidase